jgi:hypothetical protein
MHANPEVDRTNGRPTENRIDTRAYATGAQERTDRRLYPPTAAPRTHADPAHTTAELRAALTRALADPTDPCRSARPCAHAETVATYLDVAPSTTRAYLVADPAIARVDAVSETTFQALRGWTFAAVLAREEGQR